MKIKEDNCPDLSETPETEDLCDVIEDYIDPNSSSDTPGRVADAEGGAGGEEGALERLAANRRNPPAGGFNSGTMRGDDDEFLA